MASPECIDFRIPPNDILLEMIVVPAGACRRFSDEADSVVAVDAPPITVPQPFLSRDGRDVPFPVGDPDRHPKRCYGTSSLRREYIDAGPLPGTIPANQFGLLGMQAYLPQWCLVQSCFDSEPQYALRGSSRNSNFGRPQPAWYRGGSPRQGHDKSGGYGFRVRCDWVGG